MRTSLFVFAVVLTGCGEKLPEIQQKCMDEPNDNYFSNRVRYSYFKQFYDFVPDDMKAIQFHVYGEGSSDILWQVKGHFKLQNYAETDCPIVIYRSDTPPDLEQIIPINAEQVPPEEDANLGSLQLAVNLAHSGDYENTSMVLQDWSSEMDFYVTIVTCEDPTLYQDSNGSTYDITFNGCDIEGEEDVRADDEKSGTPSGLSVDVLVVD